MSKYGQEVDAKKRHSGNCHRASFSGSIAKRSTDTAGRNRNDIDAGPIALHMNELVYRCDKRNIEIWCGDMREVLPTLNIGIYRSVVADPPYQSTSLVWDTWPDGWVDTLTRISSIRSMWVFGTARMFLLRGTEFSGWRFSQEVVWEKHNGSGATADRFRPVHENVWYFYRGAWKEAHSPPPVTWDAQPRSVTRRSATPHYGSIGASQYRTEKGGARIARSVQKHHSMHGVASHPTEKPVDLLAQLVAYLPPGGLIDPFAGSGSAVVAAALAGRPVVAVEANQSYCEQIIERVSNLGTGFGLPGRASKPFQQTSFFDMSGTSSE